MKRILILHGPNLNLLGKREPHHYGSLTLEQINFHLVERSKKLGIEIEIYQTNAEHKLIAEIQEAPVKKFDFIIINPGAFTHTSIALRDAFLAVGLPFIEVHLSNIFQREGFRQHSYLADIAQGILCGFGPKGYELALDAAQHYLNTLAEVY